MSSSFYIKLKKKGVNVKDAPTIFYMGTSLTRELTSELNFVYADGHDYFWKEYEYDLTPEKVDKSLLTEYDEYTETVYNHMDGTTHTGVSINKWHLLDNELLSDVIHYYKNNLDESSKYKQKHLDDIKKYEEMACKASSVEVANSFLGKAQEIESYVSEYDEDIESSQYNYFKWIGLKDILEDANLYTITPEYELVYWHD